MNEQGASISSEVNTIGQLFLHAVRRYSKPDHMLYKRLGRYRTISTRVLADRVKWLSLALQDLGLRKGEKMILLSENGPLWVMTDLANLCLGGITVPVYTNLTPDQIRFLIENSDASVVVCLGRDLWRKIEPLRPSLSCVKHYITLRGEGGPGSVSLDRLLAAGRRIACEQPGLFERNILTVSPEDLASIIYTSGTTGNPKGVMLTHANFVGNAVTVTGLVGLTKKDTGFSFLPLSHVFERTVNLGYLFQGCSIAYAESIESVAEDMLAVRPHMFACVPRMLEKVYTRVTDNVLSGSLLKRRIFFWAVKTGKAFGRLRITGRPVPGWLAFKKRLADRLVFSKILARLGGRVRLCVSAAAPLAKELGEFFHAVGLPVLEGYGMTETSPGITINTMDNLRFGSVGRPITGVEIRLASDGEILVRGPNVMQGYYNNPAATAEALKDGWLHTGDVGVLDDDGYLAITDRKKDLIITSGGKNTAPQPTETMLKMSPYIANAVVIGDSRKFLSALIVPQFEKIVEYARINNIGFQGLKDLIRNSSIIRFIESEVDKHTRTLARFEKIKKIALLEREFELELGEITPTLKIKRNIITQKYSTLIESLYAE